MKVIVLTKQRTGWAIVGTGGDLMMFDGQIPIYWLRKVAVRCANAYGLVVEGQKKTALICKVAIRQATDGRR